MNRTLPLTLATLAALALASCSSGSVCGNGIKETGEQCDNGGSNGAQGNNCSASCTLTSVSRASIQVFYQRLKVEVPSYPNYPSPTCTDLGVDKAHVVIDGPTAVDEKVPCSANSLLKDPVEPGDYQVTITLLDAQGNALTKAIKSPMTSVQVAASATNISLEFKPEDFLKQDYKGNFDFLVSWGAKDKGCTEASPAVSTMRLRLTKAGGTTPVQGLTNSLHPLDGNIGACFMKTAGMAYQEVSMLPWGYYDLAVTGQTSGDVTAYCDTFRVFVGPGVATPTYALVVRAGGAADGGACP